MKKHFFSHLVDIKNLHDALEELNLSDNEKEHVKDLMDEGIYHTVLDAVLSELSEEDKKVFIEHLLSDEHDKIWEFVNNRIENIEDKIRKAADDIKDKIHTDIKSTKEPSDA